MRVVFIAAECEPWAKTGGLADVVDALARAVGRQPGHTIDGPVDVFLPRYRSIAVDAASSSSRVSVPDPLAAGGSVELRVHELAGDGYRLRLIDHPPAFDRAGIYGDGPHDYADNAWRFGLLCRAALEALRGDDRPLDVLHLHDWHAAPAVVFRDRWYRDHPAIAGAAALLTVHNFAYHGWTPLERLGQLGLVPGDGVVAGDAAGTDLLWTGIERAELVNTVSPSHAREALTPAGGHGLDGTLRAKGDRFFGILNGLDTAVWDPATDTDIAANYSADRLAGKAACRRDLLAAAGFDPDDRAPVLGMIGRLDPQKGFDLLVGAAERLVAGGARLVVLGSGDAGLVAGLRALAERRPDRVALIERFDRPMARRIYAGIDLFVMPSRFEPCGQGQMIALRYGSPPIVRRTGGLADTVVDEHLYPGRGTGFAFDAAEPDALLEACWRAIGLFEDGGVAWRGLVGRGMTADFDWARGSAAHYLAAYRRAIDLRRHPLSSG